MGVVTIRKAEISIALQIIAGSPVTSEEAQKEITPRNARVGVTLRLPVYGCK